MHPLHDEESKREFIRALFVSFILWMLAAHALLIFFYDVDSAMEFQISFAVMLVVGYPVFLYQMYLFFRYYARSRKKADHGDHKGALLKTGAVFVIMLLVTAGSVYKIAEAERYEDAAEERGRQIQNSPEYRRKRQANSIQMQLDRCNLELSVRKQFLDSATNNLNSLPGYDPLLTPTYQNHLKSAQDRYTPKKQECDALQKRYDELVQ